MSQDVTVQNKQEMDRPERTHPGRWFQPRVDIAENDEALWLWADMPGVDESSVEVKLEDGQLSIEGRVAIDDYANLSPVYTEYNVGNYYRSFRVSDAIDFDHIQAKMKHGVLALQLPKAAEARPRRIEIAH